MAWMITLTFTVGLLGLVNTQCKGSYYKISKDASHVFAYVSDGEYMIQLITTITGLEKCQELSPDTIQTLYAFKYAVHTINRDRDILPGVQLGYRIDDDCNTLSLVVKRALDIVSHYRANSVCRAEFGTCDTAQVPKKVLGVIGTDRSSSSIPLASLMGLFMIPVISFGASSRVLSNGDTYPSFFRTIPSDIYQARAMIDILSYFGWNYVVAIGSDDDYGKLGIAELKARSIEKDICIARDEYLPFQLDLLSAAINRTIQSLLMYPKAQVVVFFGFPQDQGEMLLREAQKQGLRKLWLVSEAWNPVAASMNIPVEQRVGILAVSIQARHHPNLSEYIRQELAEEIVCNAWLSMFVKSFFLCDVSTLFNNSLVGVSVNCHARICERCEVKVNDLIDAIVNPPSYIASNLIDAVFALGHALTSARKEMCGTNDTCVLDRLPSADSITSSLPAVRLGRDEGGLFHFDESGDPAYVRYSLSNIQQVDAEVKFVDVGTWTKLENESLALSLTLDKIQWPFWTPKAPESTCADLCQPGTYVVGKVGCCWGCEKCPEHSVSNRSMAASCDVCPSPNMYYANYEQTACLEYRIMYITPNSATGIVILSLSSIGIMMSLACFTILVRYRDRAAVEKSNPKLSVLILFTVSISFFYGPLFLFRTTEFLCQAQSCTFFTIWNLVSAYLLLKTRAVRRRLEASDNVGLSVQATLVLVLTIPELIALIVWTYVDDHALLIRAGQEEGELWLECPLNTTPAKMTSIALPSILLFTATYFSVRERNEYHPLNEPKFLRFTTTALCIILTAYLPTYKYVVGLYKATLAALVSYLILFLVIICMVAPMLYAAIVNKSMMAKPSSGYAVATDGQHARAFTISSNSLATTFSDASKEETVPGKADKADGNEASVI